MSIQKKRVCEVDPPIIAPLEKCSKCRTSDTISGCTSSESDIHKLAYLLIIFHLWIIISIIEHLFWMMITLRYI